MARNAGEIVVSPSAFLRSDSGRFLSAVELGATATVQEIADGIAGLAILFAPFRTGELAGSIEGITISSHEAAAVARAKHADPQERGARPHDIPNSFGWGHDFGYGANRNPPAPFFHPGNPAVRYLTRAAQAVAPLTPGILRKNMPG